MDQLNQVILDAAYTKIEASESKRVSGSSVWKDVGTKWDVAPPQISARLSHLVSVGLLEKDMANSSSRTKVYAPTAAGYKAWRQVA